MNKQLMDEMNSIKWWHRIELEPGLFTPGEVRHGEDGGDYASTRFGIPKDLVDKTVLDIGAWDGFFSFECEKRGAARVLAVDVPASKGGNWGRTKGFNFAKKVLNSKVEFQEASVEDLSSLGSFDITLQYGVLYHLQNLLPALKSTFRATREYTLLETAVLPASMNGNPEAPLAGFLWGYDNDKSNFWYPNYKCLEEMLRFVGYSRVELIYDMGSRVTLKATV